MAFSTVTPRLFESNLRQPDLNNVSQGMNVGLKLGEVYNQNDPNRQFVEALKARVVEDAKARQAQNLFRGIGIDVPNQGGFNQMLGGVQDPTEVLKTASTIKSNDFTNLLNSAKLQTEMAKAKNFSEEGKSDALVEQYDAYNEDGSIDFAKLPRGTTAYTDRYGRVRVRVNPSPFLTQDEIGAQSADAQMDQILGDLEPMLAGSENPFGVDGLGRDFRTMVGSMDADSFIRNKVLSKNPKLEQYVNYIDQMKAFIPFEIGGKQLTEGEKRPLYGLLNPKGKTNEKIISDLKKFKIRTATLSKLGKGGANVDRNQLGSMINNIVNGSYDNGHVSTQQPSQMTREQQAQEAIRRGADPVKVMARLKGQA